MSNTRRAQGIILILTIAVAVGVAFYYLQPGQAQPDLPTLHLDAKSNGLYVTANLAITWPDGTKNATQTPYFVQKAVQMQGHYSVVCTYQGETSLDSPYRFDLNMVHMEEYHTFLFGNSTPPSGNADHILTFIRVNSPTLGWFMQPTEITSVAFGCGGALVKSGGAWQKIMWSPESDFPQAIGIFYQTGIVYLYGDTTNQLLVQADRRPFLLFHMIRGSVTIPTIDGLTASGSRALSAGQTVILYAVNAPNAGTYLTNDVEQNPGFHVSFVTPEGVSINFGLGYGLGSGKVTTHYVSGLIAVEFDSVMYSDGTYRMPSFPIVVSGWWYRSPINIPCPLNYYALGMGYAQAYRKDPDVSAQTNEGFGYVTDVNWVNQEGFWGWSLGVTAYDASPSNGDVYLAYYTILYRTVGSDWETRKYLYVHVINPAKANNYDQDGTTTGMGLMTTSGLYTNVASQGGDYTSSFSVNPEYYAYSGQWQAETFSTNFYTWDGGGTATRITFSSPYGTVHVFTKFLYAPSGGSPMYARYYWHLFLNHYFSTWANNGNPTNIPEGSCMGVGELFSTSDHYDSTVNAPAVTGSTFYLNFFP